jgi:hypothetical protein
VRALLALWVLGCSSAAAPPPVEPVQPAGSAAPATDDSDPDGDRILGACDVCPDAKERLNDVANDDGCPETDEEILQVSTDPTNQYSGPLFRVAFAGDETTAPIDRTWQLDAEIESVACVANAPDLALAKQRAARLCKSVRSSAGKVQVVELATSNRQLYVEPAYKGTQTEHGTAVIQVLRARGIDVYRWQTDQLARATKSRVLESRPLPTGCTWAHFEQDRTSGQWRHCTDCNKLLHIEGYRARWTGAPAHPKR